MKTTICNLLALCLITSLSAFGNTTQSNVEDSCFHFRLSLLVLRKRDAAVI